MQTVFTFELSLTDNPQVSSYIPVSLSDLKPIAEETTKVDWTLFKNASSADYYVGDSVWKI